MKRSHCDSKSTSKDRRLNYEQRRYYYSFFIPDRRSGKERRKRMHTADKGQLSKSMFV